MDHRLDHALVNDSESTVGLYLLNHVSILFLELRQVDMIILQIELKTHHVLCLLHIKDLEHLLSKVKLAILLHSRTVNTIAFAIRMTCSITRFETRASVVLAKLTTSLAPLAELAADLAHEISVVLIGGGLAVAGGLLAHGRAADLVHLEWKLNWLVDV